jgi:glycosyltransferase involved in cell wall biosynthesis
MGRRPHAVFVSHLDRTLYLFRLPVLRALVDRGWRVTAVAPEEGYGARLRERGIEFTDWPLRRASVNPSREIGAVLALASRFRALAPDLVHAFAIKASLYSTVAARLAGVPMPIVSITGLGSYLSKNNAIGALFRHAAKWTRAAVFQNRDDLEVFRRMGVRFPRTELIRGSGVDLDRFSRSRFGEEELRRVRRGHGVGDDAAMVLMPARLVWDKGVREFVEAAAELRRRNGDRVACVLAGDFYEGNPNPVPRDFIEAAAGSGAIRYAGWVEEMPPLLAAADVVALPSYREGLSVSLQEAVAMGRPVVTTDVPGCREAVEDGVSGLLVPPRNAAALAEAVSKLLRDPSLRRRMGAAGRVKAEREFDAREIVKRHLALYDSMRTD